MKSGQSHITFTLALLISISLSLSTVHFHSSAEYTVTPDTHQTTTLNPETTFCPICGYLFNADLDAFVEVSSVLECTDRLETSTRPAYRSLSIFLITGRSPPNLA